MLSGTSYLKMKEEFKHVNNILFEALNLEISNVCFEEETGDYCGYNFQLGTLNIKYRKAKITLKKIGQFVALWKRDTAGNTEPYSLDDDFDFYFIETEYKHNQGCFVFPKTTLAEKQILSVKEKEGKRGFRVYTIWDIPENKQAINTKNWQILYFIDLIKDKKKSVNKLQELVKL